MLGVVPSPSAILVVVVHRVEDMYAVTFKDEWKLENYACRGDAYRNTRTRLCDLIGDQSPERICLKALEPVAVRNAANSWFLTAEIRGVIQEAAASCGVEVESRQRTAIGRMLGGKKVTECLGNDSFWRELRMDVPKKFREACILSVASLRGEGRGV